MGGSKIKVAQNGMKHNSVWNCLKSKEMLLLALIWLVLSIASLISLLL